jgi:hypothetical protein
LGEPLAMSMLRAVGQYINLGDRRTLYAGQGLRSLACQAGKKAIGCRPLHGVKTEGHDRPGKGAGPGQYKGEAMCLSVKETI